MTSSGPSDDDYADMVRDILFAEPTRGVPQQPTRLLDHVYIGSQSNAESLRLLRSLNITHVLNCAGYKGPRPTPNASPYEGLGIDYYEFKAEDTDQYNICQHFPEAFPYLDRVRRDGGVALVHCALGINRSGAVCLGYLMSHGRMPLLKATRFLKDRRRVVLANKAFHRLLVRYARSRGLLDHIMNGSYVDSLHPALHRNGKNVEAQVTVLPYKWFSNGLNGYTSDDFSDGNGKGIQSNGNSYSSGSNGHLTPAIYGNSSNSNNSRLNGICSDLYSRFDRLAETLKTAAAATKQSNHTSGTDYSLDNSKRQLHRARSQSALPSNRLTSSVPEYYVRDGSSYGGRKYWSGEWSGGSDLTRYSSLRGVSGGIGGGRAYTLRPHSYVHVSSNY